MHSTVFQWTGVKLTKSLIRECLQVNGTSPVFNNLAETNDERNYIVAMKDFSGIGLALLRPGT